MNDNEAAARADHKADIRHYSRPGLAGLMLITLAGLLLASLMAWQTQQDFRVLKAHHHSQIEESVWATAEHIGETLALRAQAVEQLLERLGMDDTGPVMTLVPGLADIGVVDLNDSNLDRPQLWMPVVQRLHMGSQRYALAADLESGMLYWAIPSRHSGRYWVLVVSEQFISRLISTYPGRGYTWLLEDTGQVIVLARQHAGRVVFLDKAPMTAGERERVLVSAPVEGALWQVRGLVEEGYYRARLGQLLMTKALVVIVFVVVLLLLLWLVLRLRRSSESLQASGEQSELRYQAIFQNAGMSLMQLDMSGLYGEFARLGIEDEAGLQAWLASDRDQSVLLRTVRIIDANPATLELLGVDSIESLQKLLRNEPRRVRKGGVRYALFMALIKGHGCFEVETPLRTVDGRTLYVWIVLRLPRLVEDYHAVTMSISDITERRRTEVKMAERERFWASVVKAVPDIVFIKDMTTMRFVYGNRSLPQALGYNRAEETALGWHYLADLLHPDDVEYHRVHRNAEQVLADGEVLEWRVRWQHKDRSWRWFALQIKVLNRLPDGRVSRVIGIVKDVSQQTLVTERLNRGEQRYRLLAENISDVIWSTDVDFNLDYVSPSVGRALGYTPEFIIEHGFAEIVAGTRFNRFMVALLRELAPLVGNVESAALLREEGFHRQTTFDCIKADGHTCPIELRVSLMWDPYGRFLGLLGIARDISEQRRTENRLRMAATVFENTTGAILVTDPAGYIVQVNENFTQITGYQTHEIIDQHPEILASQAHDELFYRSIRDTLRTQGRWEGEIVQQRKNGEVFHSWAGVSAVHDNDGDLVSYVCFFADISERKASEARIESLAYYDELTGLPNRTLFQDRLGLALQMAERRGEWVAVLFVDLDRFKPINDTLGHAAGDVMLKEVARRLRGCIRESDTVARMGGDEFTMLLAGLEDRESAMRGGIQVAEKVLAALQPGFFLYEREFFISASIGLALYPQDGREGSVLLQCADTAMYHAKALGKDTFQFFQADMNVRAMERLSMESDLRRALQDDAFTLHYQPQFDCRTQVLTGTEALLRWQHPRLGNVSPAIFIPIAEEIGLVSALGDWVLDRACRQMAEWHDAGHPQPRMAINLSARQFTDGRRLVDQVESVLRRYRLDPGCIELELTESILLQDVEGTMQTLAELKKLGVHIAVDDFGTGYSSLNYLKDFPIDTLKIDRTFINAMQIGSRDAHLAQAIVAMGRSLQLRVIAEGVETAEQLALLETFGCDEVQGFFLGRPMPASELLALYLRTE